LGCVLRSLNVHGDLLRIAFATASNDHRLGANEAPPAIVSAYLGDDVNEAVDRFLTNTQHNSKIALDVELGVGCFAGLRRATTDRNRTSPFAFTGNKFELRAVGASHSPARSNFILNTILADSFRATAEMIQNEKNQGKSVQKAQETVARSLLHEHKRVIFNGNNYSPEWLQEATKRGLLNLSSTPQALAHLDVEKNRMLFRNMGVLTEAELEARSRVFHAEYVHQRLVEAKVLYDMCETRVTPASLAYQGQLSDTILRTQSAFETSPKKTRRQLTPQQTLLNRVVDRVNGALESCHVLDHQIEQIEHEGNLAKQARLCETELLPAMQLVRDHCDALEALLPASSWPLPTYRQMLFQD